MLRGRLERERLGRRLDVCDVGHLEPVERLAVECRLGPEQRAASLRRTRARPRPRRGRRGRPPNPRSPVRGCRAARVTPPARRPSSSTGGSKRKAASQVDRVEQEAERRRRRPAFRLRLARHEPPVGVPREPALAVANEVPDTRLPAGALLPVAIGRVVHEAERPARLDRHVGSRVARAHERPAMTGLHEGVPRASAPRVVTPLAHRQLSGARAPGGAVDQLEEVSEARHPPSVHVPGPSGRLAYALGSGARRPPGDRSPPMDHLVSELLAAPLDDLMAEARRLRRGTLVTYSPKVFIPLTTLCRDVCGYCTFARPPRRGERAYLTGGRGARDRAGRARGRLHRGAVHARRPTRGALPRRAGRARGARLRDDARVPRAMRSTVIAETGLLPHLNPGVMSRDELVALRPVAASMGIMLETTAERLAARGGPHWASPDKAAGAPPRDDPCSPASSPSRSRAGS